MSRYATCKGTSRGGQVKVDNVSHGCESFEFKLLVGVAHFALPKYAARQPACWW